MLLELTTIRVGALFGLSPVNSLVLFQVLLVGLILACLGSVALLLGRPRRILPIQTVALVLIGLSPHVAVPYSDLPGATCVAVAVVTMTRASVADLLARRLLWAAAATLVLTVGTVLKPHIAMVLMAGAVMVLLVVLQTRSWQATRSAAFALGIGAALIALTLAALNLAAQHGTGLTNDRLRAVREPFPVELWLASGTYDSEEDSPVRRYGAYNQQLVDSAAEVTDPQRQRDMLRERVRDQLASRGVTDNLTFFSRKIAWVWGDGTFWASGEGTDSHQQPTHNGPLLNELSTWLVASGEHYRLKASITQGLWLAVLACTAWGVLTSRSRCLVATWALALIGLTGYLMLFEARPRYLVVLLPVLLAITLTAAPPGRR